jgi:ketose-bisphosphate aldolase
VSGPPRQHEEGDSVPLAQFPALLEEARRGGYAVGYFEAWDSYSLEAVVEAAEAERSPVIAGFGGMMLDQQWLDGGGIEMLGALGRSVVERATVPIALLLNETHTFEQAARGIDAGFNAVMIDTHRWSVAEATEAIGRLAQLAHRSGVAVEGELGSLPDATGDGIDTSHSSLTDPDEAARFVAATGIDCLAVSVGNVHLLDGRHSPIDIDRLAAIDRAVDVPLVIHGGTGFPPDAIAAAVQHGVAKFNVGTVLKRTYLHAMLDAGRTATEPGADVHALVGSHKQSDIAVAAKCAMSECVAALMRRYGSSGRATTRAGAAA